MNHYDFFRFFKPLPPHELGLGLVGPGLGLSLVGLGLDRPRGSWPRPRGSRPRPRRVVASLTSLPEESEMEKRDYCKAR